MFNFTKEQKCFKIGKITIGGQPGQNPPAAIGSIFFKSHKIVEDEQKGVFDKKKAELLINKQDEIADETGIPAILDVVGEYSGALAHYIEYIASITDSPLLLDGATAQVRMEVCQHLKEVGIIDRIIYNSIDFHSDAKELAVIKDTGLKSSMLLAFGMRFIRAQDKLRLIAGQIEGTNLLEKAQEAGIENVLIDTAVMDIPSIGMSSRAIYLVKEELGLPAGTAPCNAIYNWEKGKYFKAIRNAIISTCAVTQAMGADFVFYGSIANAPYAFPVIALVESSIAYNARFEFRIRAAENHPVTKIF